MKAEMNGVNKAQIYDAMYKYSILNANVSVRGLILVWQAYHIHFSGVFSNTPNEKDAAFIIETVHTSKKRVKQNS